MPKAFKVSIFVFLAALSLAACGKKPAPSQGAAPSMPAAVPAPVPAPAPAAPPAPPGLAGDWKGSSGDNLPLSFTVQGTQVSSLNASYSGQIGSCSFSGNFSSDGPSAVNNRSFTAHGKHDNIEFNASGNFTSDNDVSGTIVWKGKSDLCGDMNLQRSWTAKKNPPEAPEAPEED